MRMLCLKTAYRMHACYEEERKMDYTSNYRFKLPSETDVIDITVLNSNFVDIDKKLAENEQKTVPIQISDTLDIISASGNVSFYHGMITSAFNSVLQSVKTTWGDAVFRNKYGTISPSAGSKITLAITIEIVDGLIYWDEYYNGENGGEIVIGTTTITQTSTGDTTGSFRYVNDEVSASKTLELREAIIELAQQIQALRKE